MAYDCYRCKRSFNSPKALGQHKSDSVLHNICVYCQPWRDFLRRDELNGHLEHEHSRCWACDDNFFRDMDAHDVEVHNKCLTCGGFFPSPSNLRSVRIVYQLPSEAYIPCIQEIA